MLAVPGWRCRLDLDSEEAVSLTAALLEEEAAALNRAADGEAVTEVTPALPFVSCADSRLEGRLDGLMGLQTARARRAGMRSLLFPRVLAPLAVVVTPLI